MGRILTSNSGFVVSVGRGNITPFVGAKKSVPFRGGAAEPSADFRVAPVSTGISKRKVEPLPISLSHLG
jgi:hypothetical protein